MGRVANLLKRGSSLSRGSRRARRAALADRLASLDRIRVLDTRIEATVVRDRGRGWSRQPCREQQRRSHPATGIRANAYQEFGGIPTIGTVIRANLVRDAATDGIAIASETVNDTVVEANLIIGSGNDGIKIARAATTLTRNLALHNANLGIEAMPGVTDGGGNHAYGNGNPLQCINITC